MRMQQWRMLIGGALARCGERGQAVVAEAGVSAWTQGESHAFRDGGAMAGMTDTCDDKPDAWQWAMHNAARSPWAACGHSMSADPSICCGMGMAMAVPMPGQMYCAKANCMNSRWAQAMMTKCRR